MATYGIGVTPLINKLIEILINGYVVQVKVLTYAVDFSAVGGLEDPRIKWIALNEIGSKFGYYPEPIKT